MKRIAIIGGGISGLSAAFYLQKARRSGAEVGYTLFEAGSRLGGVLRSERVEGCLVEAGPDSFLSEKPSAAVLCRDLGIADQLIGSNDAHRKTFILVRNRLVEMPDGLQFMVPTKLLPTVLTPLFSWGTKLRMGREFFARPRKSNGDESAAAFVERHFGREVVERLADPLLAGVYGGSAERLSVRAVLPRFLEVEAKHGSLSRAMIAARKAHPAPANGARPIFTSMKDGMQQLVDAVVAQLDPAALRKTAPVQAVSRSADEWLISRQGSTAERFDAVILAIPAYVAGSLLRDQQRLTDVLAQVPYSSSMTVVLGFEATSYDGCVGRRPEDGFGFLVPRREGKRIRACTFVHNKFPHRTPGDRLLLRVFLGGSEDAGVLQLGDDEVLRTVRRELDAILGLKAEPSFTRIYRWERAMAQYEVGHLERVAEIERLAAAVPGLHLIGNAYRGIGVPDCIRSGMDAADRVVQNGA